jgi:hypothetical protein
MKAHGERMDQLLIVEKILRSMTRQFDYVVAAIEESNDLNTMTIDELQSSLLVHEQRMQSHVREEQVLKVTLDDSAERKNDVRYDGRGRGRGGYRGRGRGRGRQQSNRALVECYKCHKLGHLQYECPDWERNAHYAELDETEDMLLMAHAECDDKKSAEIWFLDSGCSNHMTGNKQWFTDIDEQYQQYVKLGNNFKMTVAGKGNIRLHVNGITQVITNVYCVP